MVYVNYTGKGKNTTMWSCTTAINNSRITIEIKVIFAVCFRDKNKTNQNTSSTSEYNHFMNFLEFLYRAILQDLFKTINRFVRRKLTSKCLQFHLLKTELVSYFALDT